MNIGKLYQVKEYFWLLYPSKDIAAAHRRPAAARSGVGPQGVATAAWVVAYYSKEYNYNVSYLNPNSIFCLLEQDGNFMKILSTEGNIGWIILSDLCKNYIEEVNQ